MLRTLGCANAAAWHSAHATQRMPLTAPGGAPLWRVGLGGAARANPPQPASLPGAALASLPGDTSLVTFVYNPHRYPAFVSGVRQLCEQRRTRARICLQSGTHDRSPAGISTRISDACELLGAAHLDAFFAEYVCPDEHLQDVRDALLAASSDPRVRAVGASTHSVSAASALLDLHEAEDDPLLDAIMLRVGMAHQVHETASTLERAAALGVPVVGFCSTRWNGLLEEAPELGLGAPPSAAECVGWSLGSQGVEYVVHSSRNQRELTDVLVPAAALADTLCGGSGERERWSRYGDAWCEARGTSDGFEADAA